jgi:hypothetical protein
MKPKTLMRRYFRQRHPLPPPDVMEMYARHDLERVFILGGGFKAYDHKYGPNPEIRGAKRGIRTQL